MASNQNITLRLRLIGYALAIRESYRVAAATTAMGLAAQKAAKSQAELSRRSFLTNQSLFTMRRLLYQATLATGALAAAGVVLGFSFNATVERATIALDFLSRKGGGGPIFNATEQMKEFLRIARETAFLPKQVIDIGQQMIAFGFSAETTNRTLRAMGNALAALNLPQATMDRIVLAFGQIQVKGRLMGEEIRQLANAGIPVYGYLEKALGKNVTQLNRIGDARIPAQVAIEAIVRGLEAQYGGASERIRETTSGQFEILKGDLQTILGGITFTAFEAAGDRLQRITAVTGQMFDEALEGSLTFTRVIEIIDEATGGAYHLVTAVERLHKVFQALWDILGLVVQVATPFLKLLVLILYGITFLADAIIYLIEKGGRPLVIALQLIVAWFIIERVTAILLTSSQWGLTAARIAGTFWTNRQAGAVRLLTVLLGGRYRAAVISATVVTWFLNAALFANPFVLVALSVIVLIGVFTLLYWKTKDLILVLGLMLIPISPLIAAITLIYKGFDKVTASVTFLWDKLKAFYGWLQNHSFGLIGGGAGEKAWWQKSGIDIIRGGFATGGMTGVSGSYVVGERGPEIVKLPAGAAVAPVSPMRTNLAAAAGGTNVIVEPQPIFLDGRQIAEVVYKHRLDRLARR